MVAVVVVSVSMASTSSTCISSLSPSPSPSLSSSRHHLLLPSRRASFPFHFPKKRTQKGFRAFRPPNPPHAVPNIHSRIHSRREIKATPVTKDQWENSILNSETPVLVEFYASWCGPCRMVHRIIDEIAAEYDGRLKCFVLNTDTDMPIAEDYEIKAVPVVLLFKNGQKCDTVIGTMPKEFYVAAVERVLKS